MSKSLIASEINVIKKINQVKSDHRMCSLVFLGNFNLCVEANQAVFCFSKTELGFTPAKAKLRGLRHSAFVLSFHTAAGTTSL